MMKILLYDDNLPFRDGLNMLFSGTSGYSIVGAYSNCSNVEREVTDLQPDIVLMDIDMPGLNGIDGLKLIKNKFSSVRVVMLTVFEDDKNVFLAMKAGADGYLLKKTWPV
jgi:DNA-binding NarL/FixJ family response regulator